MKNMKNFSTFGLIFALLVATSNSSSSSSTSAKLDSSHRSRSKSEHDKPMINNQFDDSDDDNSSGSVDDEQEQMPINEQISLLSRQFKLLNEKRQEEYRMLERGLRTFVEKHLDEYVNVDIQKELKDLRAEIKILHQGVSPKREKLTEWLSSSIAELRTEVAELQSTAANLTRSCHQRNLIGEEMRSVHNEMSTFKLELSAIRARQDKSEALLRELRDEMIQGSGAEELGNGVNAKQRKHPQQQHLEPSSDEYQTNADRKKRHYRLLRDMVHEVDSKQRTMQKHIIELDNQRLIERVRSLELAEERLSAASNNLSRQSTDADKLHTSMLQLFEDVEDIESKFDKSIPEIQREISKVEIDSAQLSSDQNMLKEEEHNMVKTIQALAVSVSTLQNEQSNIHSLESEINKLRLEVEMLRADKASTYPVKAKFNENNFQDDDDDSFNDNYADDLSHPHSPSKFFAQLEDVVHQYENILQSLPSDCSQINTPSDTGLHMIAPSHQHRPIMAKCIGAWTVVQRREDGSVNFNRSWDEYAEGFGSANGELWIGNEMLHQLTRDNCTQLRIIIQDLQNNSWYADYEHISIASRDEGYRIDFSGYSGNASNTLEYQNHMKFSSIDRDLDISKGHCADEYEGGWWFSHCLHANLNGRYNLGLTWYDLSRNEWVAVKSSIMMITKRHECLKQSNENFSENSDETSGSSSSSTSETKSSTLI